MPMTALLLLVCIKSARTSGNCGVSRFLFETPSTKRTLLPTPFNFFLIHDNLLVFIFKGNDYLNLSIISPTFYHVFILYFVAYIKCSRKQLKLEIKRGLHSLRLDRSLDCDQLWLKMILAQTKNFIFVLICLRD